jgi:hypothetical protein
MPEPYEIVSDLDDADASALEALRPGDRLYGMPWNGGRKVFFLHLDSAVERAERHGVQERLAAYRVVGGADLLGGYKPTVEAEGGELDWAIVHLARALMEALRGARLESRGDTFLTSWKGERYLVADLTEAQVWLFDARGNDLVIRPDPYRTY